MTLQRAVELTKIEYECILRNCNGECDRNCIRCDIVQEDKELQEAYQTILFALDKLVNRQLPHVMTYDEIRNMHIGDVVYEEIKGLGVRPMTFDGIDLVNGSAYLMMAECEEDDCADYNWNYRVWSNMPDGAMINATPWKSDPYKETQQ